MDFCAARPEEAALGLRLLTAIKEYWVACGLVAEGRHRLAVLCKAAPADGPDRAAGLWQAAFLALMYGERPAYLDLVEQATAVARRTRDRTALGYLQLVRAHVPLFDNDMRRAAELFGAAAQELRAVGEGYGEFWALRNYGLAIGVSGDLERGREVLTEVDQRHAEHGEVIWRSWALFNRGALEYLTGGNESALDFGRRGLRLQIRAGNRLLMALLFSIIAGALIRTGRLRDAARLSGAAGALWHDAGGDPTSTYAVFHDQTARNSQIVAEGLSGDVLADELARGYQLPLAEAIALALGEAPAAEPAGELTKRQVEIAGLVAEGLTNREIADRLVISRRTAETHVDHILTKLGLHNRAQIAAWMVTRRSRSIHT